MATQVSTRLDPAIFRLPVDRIREGYYSDAYFVLTKTLLESEDHHPQVTMQVFQKRDSVLGGIDEPEEAKASFVAEMMQRSPAPAEVVAFALKDPSPRVRKSLLSFVWWGMSTEEISRFSQTLDAANFKELIAGMHASELPPSMHPRALESYVAAANDEI